MSVRLLIWVVCALMGTALGVLQKDIQHRAAGGCNYQGRRVPVYSEYVPVYNPKDNFGCVRVLCKDYTSTHLEMAVHSCNPEYIRGRRAELWPGQRYPDCCKKLY